MEKASEEDGGVNWRFREDEGATGGVSEGGGQIIEEDGGASEDI